MVSWSALKAITSENEGMIFSKIRFVIWGICLQILSDLSRDHLPWALPLWLRQAGRAGPKAWPRMRIQGQPATWGKNRESRRGGGVGEGRYRSIPCHLSDWVGRGSWQIKQQSSERCNRVKPGTLSGNPLISLPCLMPNVLQKHHKERNKNLLNHLSHSHCSYCSVPIYLYIWRARVKNCLCRWLHWSVLFRLLAQRIPNQSSNCTLFWTLAIINTRHQSELEFV